VQDKARIRPDASEVMVLMANAGKAREELGWTPDTDLDSGLQATIDYVGLYLKKFKTDIYNI
jgi:UDP-glucose 4-epimerase